MDYSIKELRKEFKEKGVFYTPPELGKYIKSLVVGEPDEVYDMTCGRGNLLSVFPDNVRKYGQEIDRDAVEDARKVLVNADIRCGDTIKEDAFNGKKFKLIIGNPPFSIKYEPTEEIMRDERFKDSPCLPPPSKADYLFILHAISKLEDDGVAYILEFPGILYRGQKEGKIRDWLIEKNYIDAVYQIPPKQFTDTSIATCMLVIRKDRKGKDTILMADVENELERNVPIKEITDNDGNLSVSSYVQKQEEPKKYESPEDINKNVHASNLRALETMLKWEQFVCELEGWDFQKILKDYQEVIDRFDGAITFKE